MQGLVRNLYGELIEFEDLFATNVTVSATAVWGNALDWAVSSPRFFFKKKCDE